ERRHRVARARLARARHELRRRPRSAAEQRRLLMNPRIEKLEALLSRIRGNSQAPRHAHAAPAAPSQSAEVQILEPETQKSIPTPPPAGRAPEPEIPLESRARLVAAPHAELEELEAEDVLELDDRHVVRE